MLKIPLQYRTFSIERKVMKEGQSLKQLGSINTQYKYNDPSTEILETFENKYPSKDYEIQFLTSEFTSLCPRTKQPDFASIEIKYIANKKCVETKSLKLYLFSYRQYGSFMETITNKILEDLVSVCQPRKMIVIGRFNARGGIGINVTAKFEK